jgi:hypothetical protein
VKRRQIGWAGVLLAAACAGNSRPTLSDADQVRLDAFVEVTAPWSTAAVCLAVDARTIPGANTDAGTVDQAQDPTGTFWVAVSQVGHVYPESRCSRGPSAQGLAPIHPEGKARRGVFVALGPVGLSPDGRRAVVRVLTWPGEMQTEIHVLRYRKSASEWKLEQRTLAMQE